MKIFPQNNLFSEGIIEIFMFLLKSAFVIFSFLILMAVIDSDFMQRIKHQTYGNCVKNYLQNTLCQLWIMMSKVRLFSMTKAKLLILKPLPNIGVHNYSKWNRIKTHNTGLLQL